MARSSVVGSHILRVFGQIQLNNRLCGPTAQHIRTFSQSSDGPTPPPKNRFSSFFQFAKEVSGTVQHQARPVSQSSDSSAPPPKPKRPISSFIKFSQEIHKQNPGLKITQRTTIAGEKWRLMTDEQKAPYKPTSAEIQAYNENLMKWMENLTEQQKIELEQAEKKRKASIAKLRLKQRQRQLERPKQPARNAFSYYVKSMPIPRGDAPITMYVQGLAQQWRKMALDDKEPYETQATQAKEKFRKELEEWETKMIEAGHYNLVRLSSLPKDIDRKTLKPKKPRKATKPKKKKPVKKAKKRTSKKGTETAKKAKTKKSAPRKEQVKEEDTSWMRDE